MHHRSVPVTSRRASARPVEALLAAVALLAACGGEPAGPAGLLPPVLVVEVSLSVTSLSVGDPAQAVARVRDAQGFEVQRGAPSWSSSDPTVARVDAAGRVTAMAPGAADIVATVEGLRGAARLEVTDVPVATLEVSLAAPQVLAGEATRATATPRDARGEVLEGRTVHWSSSDPTVAMVDAGGVVTTLAPGRVVITATCEGRSGSVDLEVLPVPVAPVPVASVSATVTPSTVIAGEPARATAVARASDGTPLLDRAIRWTSSAPGVAVVDDGGAVATLAPGVATLTATCEGRGGSVELEVLPVPVVPVPVASVSVVVSPSTVVVGDAAQATALPRDATGAELPGRTVEWSTSDPAVAVVDGDGRVTTLSVGMVAVTASSEGRSGSAWLEVVPVPVASVSVSLWPAAVTVGQPSWAMARTVDGSGNLLTGRAVAWSSSDPSVALVGADGTVSAVGVGTAVITATSEGRSGSAVLTVGPAPVATVTASVTPSRIEVGRVAQATAVARDASGNALAGRAIAWSSSDAGVATVTAAGLVTAVAPGRVALTATSEGQGGSAWLEVVPVPVASVSVSLAPASVVVGQGVQATAVLHDAGGSVLSGRAVEWTTNHPAVAVVSASGAVTTLSAGSVTVTATSEGRSGSASLEVAPVPVASVAVSLARSALLVGEDTQGTATVRDASGNLLGGRAVTWSSSNGAVASVAADGLVTAVGVGSAIVTATSEGRSGSAALSVSPVPVATVLVTLSASSVFDGQAAQAAAVTLNASGNVLTGRTITWSTSDLFVARVDGSGRVTTVAPGDARIIATSEGQSGSRTLYVLPVPVASLAVSIASSTVDVGARALATATPRDAAGNALAGRVVTWRSAAASIASVDGSGWVTGIGSGSTTITATCEGVSSSVAVRVVPPGVASVSVSLDAIRLAPGATTTARATVRDALDNVLTGREVTWSTSDGSVATVDAAGQVRAVAAGYASIRATSEGVTGSATLTVAASGASGRTILVIGPHPDDETLIGAGRTRAAVNAGDVVKVVTFTNGDAHGTTAGLTRQAESVAAAQVLGLSEQDVIFLAYPDGSLLSIYDASSGTQVFTGSSGASATYGNRGLGGMDYHRYLTGAAGPYSRDTIRQDVAALLRTYQPDEIYTVTPYDDHPDHRAVALFVEDALASLRDAGEVPPTRLFQTIVWVPGETTWPQIDPGGFTPTVPFLQPTQLESRTPLRWSDAYHFDVPPEMRSTSPGSSLKYLAIQQYRSQLSSWLTSFARADEFYWLTSY